MFAEEILGGGRFGGIARNSRAHLAQPTYTCTATARRKENFIDKVDNILYQLNKIYRKLFASHVIYKLTLKKLCAKLFKRLEMAARAVELCVGWCFVGL